MRVETEGYERPSIADYGDLRELTSQIALNGRLDGASFSVANHHTCSVEPCLPHQPHAP